MLRRRRRRKFPPFEGTHTKKEARYPVYPSLWCIITIRKPIKFLIRELDSSLSKCIYFLLNEFIVHVMCLCNLLNIKKVVIS